MLANNVDIRENWNFPNSCSIALARSSGLRVFSASAIPRTVALKSPLFFSTIPRILIPTVASISDAFLLGLMIDARPDFNAFAPSAALIPPSFIAVIKNAKSLTSPPRDFTIGAAIGIAVVTSSRDKTVWFSTELRKLIESARS